MFCTNCGNKPTSGAAFCGKCGSKVVTDQASKEYSTTKSKVQPAQPRKKISNVLRVLITLIIILALAAGAFWILLDFEIIDYNSLPSFVRQFLTDTQQMYVQPPPPSEQSVSIDGMYGQSELSAWDYEEVLHYVYRSDVINFDHPIMYSYIENGDTVIITVYNPDNAMRALSIADTFVLGPTTQNPFGISGHVVSIIEQETNLIITASIPESLDEIFYEFEFVGEIDVLSEDIVVADSTGEYHPGDFTEVTRNRTSMINWNFNRTHAGINVRGNVRVDTPRVRARLSLRGVDELVLIMGASVSAHASSSGNVNHVFPIGSLRVSPVWPVRIDIPVGIRVDASGNVSLDFSARADAEFGIRRNQAFGRTSLTYDFDFDFYGRVALSLNIQARAIILGIFRNHNVYGIEGDFGKGLEASSALQARCATNQCLVVRLFHVRRIRSLNGWGALGGLGALRFDTNLPSPSDSFRFISGGRWLRFCPHDHAAVDESQHPAHAADSEGAFTLPSVTSVPKNVLLSALTAYRELLEVQPSIATWRWDNPRAVIHAELVDFDGNGIPELVFFEGTYGQQVSYYPMFIMSFIEHAGIEGTGAILITYEGAESLSHYGGLSYLLAFGSNGQMFLIRNLSSRDGMSAEYDSEWGQTYFALQYNQWVQVLRTYAEVDISGTRFYINDDQVSEQQHNNAPAELLGITGIRPLLGNTTPRALIANIDALIAELKSAP